MELEKTYDPRAYEAEIYKLWETSRAFEPGRPDGQPGEPARSGGQSGGLGSGGRPFCIIMPPPNANNQLHIGQATYVKQDVKARFRRMMGDRVLYLPGADHAGFETWYVFEKELAKAGKSRFDYSDEELYQMTYDFVVKNMDMAKDTYRVLGLSCSWDNFTFTLDDKITINVREVFKKMWDEGLVYRGERLVNYCTQHRTSFSDIEVEYEDRTSPLYYLKYGPFELATTRPETIFGDVAVAVHPEDERYANLVGKEVEVEGPIGPFKVQVVADESVEREFGTGAVKVTPAHDFNDAEIAERHGLPRVPVIGLDGKMLESAGEFAGMEVLEAREAVALKLKEKGLLLKVDEDYANRVGVCYKCQTVIEPMLMEQWFVDMKPMAARAIEAIEAGKIKFKPANRAEMGIDYLKNIKDWNISRQIPWGIRVPAFRNEDSGEWIYSDSEDNEIEIDGKKYLRDTDTFDTWMSSSQFPYLALGYPDSDEFKGFFPTSWLQHGREIFTQWGLRMIMMALYMTGEVPFKTLYVNGLIRGEDGRKMSKSIGNTVSAVELLDEYGSDALRFGMLMIDSVAGADKAFDRSKMVSGRNFSNKLWNLARFVENLLDEAGLSASELNNPELKFSSDHWIVAEVGRTADEVAKLLDEDEFGEALAQVYELVWNKFADWYVEAAKLNKNLEVLVWALENILKIAHPFAPFVTETIWQSLKLKGGEKLLVIEDWPKVDISVDMGSSQNFKEVKKVVEFARSVKAFVDGDVTIEGPNEEANLARFLARAKGEGQSEVLTVSGVEREWRVLLDQSQLEQYRERIGERVDEIQEEMQRLEARLNNKSYVDNAPEKLVDETKESLAKLKDELVELRRG